MRVYYSRYTEISYLKIFGGISDQEWRVLQRGFYYICKELDTPMLINLTGAIIEPEIFKMMPEFRTKIHQITTQKVSVIYPDPKIGDYRNLDLFFQVNKNSDLHQILEEIKIEDEIHQLEMERLDFEEKLKNLGFDLASSKLEILKNQIIKSQKQTIDSCLKWQNKRNLNMKKVPSQVVDLETSIVNCLAEIKKALGKDVDL